MKTLYQATDTSVWAEPRCGH